MNYVLLWGKKFIIIFLTMIFQAMMRDLSMDQIFGLCLIPWGIAGGLLKESIMILPGK